MDNCKNSESAVYVAKYIISRCSKLGSPVSPLNLQYILYFAQKECLKNGYTAFYDDIEAWDIGPCVPSVYYRFCSYAGMPIWWRDEDVIIGDKRKEIIDAIIAWAVPMFDINRAGELHERACANIEAWAQVYIKEHSRHDALAIPTYLIKKC